MPIGIIVPICVIVLIGRIVPIVMICITMLTIPIVPIVTVYVIVIIIWHSAAWAQRGSAYAPPREMLPSYVL